jgi:hypothetical protein
MTGFSAFVLCSNPGLTTSRDAVQAHGAARKAGSQVKELESRLDRALLACEAMWTLVRDKLGVTDGELFDRINEIDLSDGKLDGKVRKTAVSCPSCGRTIASRHARCMYCGQAVMKDPFA